MGNKLKKTVTGKAELWHRQSYWSTNRVSFNLSGECVCIPRYSLQGIVLIFLSLRNMRLDKELPICGLKSDRYSTAKWTHLSRTRITAWREIWYQPKCVLGIPELLQRAFHNLGAQLFGAGKQVAKRLSQIKHTTNSLFPYYTLVNWLQNICWANFTLQVVSDTVYLRQDEISITNTLNRFIEND